MGNRFRNQITIKRILNKIGILNFTNHPFVCNSFHIVSRFDFQIVSYFTFSNGIYSTELWYSFFLPQFSPFTWVLVSFCRKSLPGERKRGGWKGLEILTATMRQPLIGTEKKVEEAVMYTWYMLYTSWKLSIYWDNKCLSILFLHISIVLMVVEVEHGYIYGLLNAQFS